MNVVHLLVGLLVIGLILVLLSRVFPVVEAVGPPADEGVGGEWGSDSYARSYGFAGRLCDRVGCKGMILVDTSICPHPLTVYRCYVCGFRWDHWELKSKFGEWDSPVPEGTMRGVMGRATKP